VKPRQWLGVALLATVFVALNAPLVWRHGWVGLACFWGFLLGFAAVLVLIVYGVTLIFEDKP